MKPFEPNYMHLVDAAYNRTARRLPLYEHLISNEIMERVLGVPFPHPDNDHPADILENLKLYCRFYREMEYDTVSYENCVGPIMPGSGALGAHKAGVIKTMADFDAYPWQELPDLYFQRNRNHFAMLGEALPPGMKAVGGVGNGVFECVQDIVGYTDLCYIAEDDPELYAKLFAAVGDALAAIWSRFLPEFGDAFCVLRMGDDLGFKSNTLLSANDIRTHIVPQYRRVADLVHAQGKPFLLHSCGCLFPVFDDIIAEARIDAKHSNEDQIATFDVWVDRYGDRIGNFGGIDTDAVCRLGPQEMREYIVTLLDKVQGRGGIAFSSGNSIPSYVPVEGYLTMIETVREYRGDFR